MYVGGYRVCGSGWVYVDVYVGGYSVCVWIWVCCCLCEYLGGSVCGWVWGVGGCVWVCVVLMYTCRDHHC